MRDEMRDMLETLWEVRKVLKDMQDTMRAMLRKANFETFRAGLLADSEDCEEYSHDDIEYAYSTGKASALEKFAVASGIFTPNDISGFNKADKQAFMDSLWVFTVTYFGETEYFLNREAAIRGYMRNAEIGANPVLGSVKYASLQDKSIEFHDAWY